MQAKGIPYGILMPENRCVCVLRRAHQRSRCRPGYDAVPSSGGKAGMWLPYPSAAMKSLVKEQLLQPKYTMHSFDWFDQRDIDGTPLVRPLRSHRFSDILPEIRLASSSIFDEQYHSHPQLNGEKLCAPILLYHSRYR